MPCLPLALGRRYCKCNTGKSAYLHSELLLMNFYTEISMKWKELLFNETPSYNIRQLTEIAVSQINTQPESPILEGELKCKQY